MIRAEVGYASDRSGRGVAYARLHSVAGAHVLRVTFGLRAGFDARETAFAALTTVARTLRRRGVRNVIFAVEEAELEAAVERHGELDAVMVLPYVRLKCALNGFDEVRIDTAEASDLTQRARAEIALHPAA